MSISPKTLAREITMLIRELDFPDPLTSNNPSMVNAAHDLFIAQMLSGLVKQYEKAADKIKANFSAKLTEPCEPFELIVTSLVTVTAKVTQPRETFDKDAFIKAVSTECDIHAAKLYTIADDCVKKSKAPVSLTATLNVV